MMVNNMREQLVKAGYAQNSRPNMQIKGQQFDFENFKVGFICKPLCIDFFVV